VVSSRGRVRSITRRTRSGRLVVGRWMKLWIREGYWCVGLTDRRGRQWFISVHRLVAIAFIPNPGSKPQVNHIDGDRTNCSLENLEWVTAKENAVHASRLGVLADKRGEGHHMAKLSDEKVIEIRGLYGTGLYSQREIAELFGVGQPAASRVIRGVRWGHIPQENR
jgi:predicted XRE-type DNA-binding protein